MESWVIPILKECGIESGTIKCAQRKRNLGYLMPLKLIHRKARREKMAKDHVLQRSISVRIVCPCGGKILTLIMGLETGKYYAFLNVVEDNILFSKSNRISWRIIFSYKMHGHNDQRIEIHIRNSLGAGDIIYLCLCFQHVVESLTPPWY